MTRNGATERYKVEMEINHYLLTAPISLAYSGYLRITTAPSTLITLVKKNKSTIRGGGNAPRKPGSFPITASQYDKVLPIRKQEASRELFLKTKNINDKDATQHVR